MKSAVADPEVVHTIEAVADDIKAEFADIIEAAVA